MANRGEVSFYQQMSRVAKCFYDGKGNKRVIPATMILDNLYGTDAGNQVIAVLEQVVDFAMDKQAGVFSQAVKSYYVQDLRQTQFARKIGMSFNSFHTQLQRGKNAVTNLFGEDVLMDLTGANGVIVFNGEFRNKTRLAEYRSKLIRASKRERALYKYVSIKFGAEEAKCEYKEFDDYSWRVGFELLSSTTPIGKQLILQRLLGDVTIPKNTHTDTAHDVELKGFIGYINYLLNVDNELLQANDVSRKAQLEQLISLNETLAG